MIFRYRALDEGGKAISGVIDADSFALAKERLLKQQILLVNLSEQASVNTPTGHRRLCPRTSAQQLLFVPGLWPRTKT